MMITTMTVITGQTRVHPLMRSAGFKV